MFRISATSASCRNLGSATPGSVAPVRAGFPSVVHNPPDPAGEQGVRAEHFRTVRARVRGGGVADLVSPQATRLAVPRWLDVRVALGLLLVLVSVVAGAR